MRLKEKTKMAKPPLLPFPYIIGRVMRNQRRNTHRASKNCDKAVVNAD
jgi:hypothetical protein